MAVDVVKIDRAKILEASKVGIETKDGTVTLTDENQVTVTTTDIRTLNGVIHVIDAVLMPPSETAMQDKQ
jgi:uncharacterized surface protein with fasciclin (FAS1) repeats